MAGILRTAHGKGAPALLVAERPPLDEMSPPNADDTARGLALRSERGRPFTPGNAAAKNRKPALATMGVDLDAGDPRHRAAMRKARRYRDRRVRELAVAHGGELGAGACAILSSGAMALAASRLLHGLASEALAGGEPKAAADLFKQAASLADSHRQSELTAIAIAERDARSKPASDPHKALREAFEAEERERARKAAP